MGCYAYLWSDCTKCEEGRVEFQDEIGGHEEWGYHIDSDDIPPRLFNDCSERGICIKCGATYTLKKEVCVKLKIVSEDD